MSVSPEARDLQALDGDLRNLADYLSQLTVTQGVGAGQPLRLLPEQLVQAMLSTPPDAVFEEREYRCSNCGREVGYPETLYRDGRCEVCHAAITV